jgi:hypothetical protein
MPTRLLAVPHRVQEEDKGCLAACAQMVLAHLSVKQSQRALNRLFGLTSIGVPFSNIRRIAKLKLTVAVRTGDDGDLRRVIDQGLPPVVFVFTVIFPIGPPIRRTRLLWSAMTRPGSSSMILYLVMHPSMCC